MPEQNLKTIPFEFTHQLRRHDLWACNCGILHQPPADANALLREALETFMQELALQFPATDAFRLVVHSSFDCGVNSRRESTSQHWLGRAADFHVTHFAYHTGKWSRVPVPDLAQTANRLGIFGGIGLYDWGIHLDVRKGAPVHWDERTKKGATK